LFPGNSKPTHPHGHGHSTIKDLAGSILGDDKKDDGELWNNVEAQTAFLGPNLWDKTYETDLKVINCVRVSLLRFLNWIFILVRGFGRVSFGKRCFHGRFGFARVTRTAGQFASPAQEREVAKSQRLYEPGHHQPLITCRLK
jgi:hypothetical protein